MNAMTAGHGVAQNVSGITNRNATEPMMKTRTPSARAGECTEQGPEKQKGQDHTHGPDKHLLRLLHPLQLVKQRFAKSARKSTGH